MGFSHRSNIMSFYLGTFLTYWMYSYTTWAATVQDLVILDELLKKGYDRRATPTNHYNKSTPTSVYCELYMRSMSSPNPLSMDYKVDLYLIQRWRDERLQHVDLKQPLDLNDPNLVKAIWKPEVYFPNAKDADFQFVTVPNVLVRIHPDGEILYMLRLKVTFSCMMDLSKFPLDRQVCGMEVASFSKTVEELKLEWKKTKPVTTPPNPGLSLFVLVEVNAKRCKENETLPTGNYSCLVAEFHLARSMGFHLVQSYLPTILMVIISWVSFWMDVNSVPGRVTLGVTTLLTVSSKASNVQGGLPESSYIKAIDVWMGTCTAFVFLALLEFTVVNYLWRNNTKSKMTKSKSADHGLETKEHLHGSERNLSACNTLVQVKENEEGTILNHLEPRFIRGGSNNHLKDLDHPMIQVEGSMNPTPLTLGFFSIANPQALARAIDETCRYCFPMAFAFFNCIYWPYYCL